MSIRQSLFEHEKRLILPSAQERTPEWEEQFVENYWLGLGDTSLIHTVNPFFNQTQFDRENPHYFILNLMRNPAYFGFTVKTLFGKKLRPFQLAILRELWTRPFPMLIGSRGAGKSWILAVYAMLRALFDQGTKIIICGAAFRQAKVVFDYCHTLWDKSPILRDIVGPDKRNGPKRDVDRCVLRMGDSEIIALPIGDGTKIRGQRARVVIGDEFASIPVDIFETVIRGFAAVEKDPSATADQEARVAAIKLLGRWHPSMDEVNNGKLTGNQIIVSGTAYYAFNHFYDYWRQYKAIVESQGDTRKLEEVFNGKIPEGFDWKKYSVIRIPVEALPSGFMSKDIISQAKATVHVGIFQMEYGAVFATDSNGFYKRSTIENCVVGKPSNPVVIDGEEVRFTVATRGNPKSRYVLSVDPASESDNFSITILEIFPNHRRIVYGWTTTRSRYKEKLKRGLVKQSEYYKYTARKIRDLMLAFNVERIALDSQGGGVAVMEALADKDQLQEGEEPLYPTIDPDKEKDTDHLPGKHIIEVINFAQADWVRDANHGMRKDFEDRVLLFPEFNSALLGMAIEDDKAAGRVVVDTNDMVVERLYDTMEDAMMEIEDLKDELATIVHTQTGTSMRDRWDTPETKIAGGKKGRLRKDRYSSLLMANMVARQMQRAAPIGVFASPIGGFANQLQGGKSEGALYSGPQWWCDGTDAAYGVVARRK